jgi:tetratricopeptide (TPR) repeat protein
MSIAAKHRKKGAEFEQLKQFDRAIASYIRAIDESEAAGEDVDVALFNKVGDLTLRQGRVADAVTYYERAVEHYAQAGLHNNAIALCNKILRHAPGRAAIYHTLGRICAQKGLRGDATRNFLEYAARMRADGRLEEAMHALADAVREAPHLVEVRAFVEEQAARAGVALRRMTPAAGSDVAADAVAAGEERSGGLVFLDLGIDLAAGPAVVRSPTPVATATGGSRLEDALIFDPTMVGPATPPEASPAIREQVATDEPAGGGIASVHGIGGAPDVPPPAADDGIEVYGDFTDTGVPPLDGFTPENEYGEPLDGADPHPGHLTTGARQSVEATPEAGLESHRFEDVVEEPVEPLALEPLQPLEPLDTLPRLPERAGEAPPPDAPAAVETPVSVPVVQEPHRTPAGGRAVPPLRLDPHDFILPGELPPLQLPDAIVREGIARARAAVAAPVVAPVAAAEPEQRAAPAEPATPVTPVTPAEPTPAPVPLSPAVHEARARVDALRAAVAEAPGDWTLRRRLAEVLLETGDGAAALAELETVMQGQAVGGDLAAASDVADELVRIQPDRVAYHQRRVELAVRLGTPERLKESYLDLADALVRAGDDARSRAVYARVLELDPWDDRARAALGDAAPPPPERPPVGSPDDGYVSLEEWLRDDAAPSTRMRMPEPAVTGNEDADFEALLRHFKEGVARSVHEEDYDSHYDLGVAYKEMGLLDDAIAEFQKALRGRARRLPAYEALGQCFVEQQRYQVAATVLSRALHEPGLDDEQRIGVLYLLGYACEALQRWDQARGYYQRVYATDIQFRDVAARLAALDRLAP